MIGSNLGWKHQVQANFAKRKKLMDFKGSVQK